MPDGSQLLRLQEIELKVIENRKRIQELEASLENDSALVLAEESLQNARDKLRSAETTLRDLGLNIESCIQKRHQSEDRLYSGVVTNPRELQEIEAEVEGLKVREAQLEELAEQAQGTADAARVYLTTEEASYDEVRKQVNVMHRDQVDELERLRSDNASLLEERTSVAKKLPTALFETYASMRKSKASRPVAHLQGDACGVCGIQQTRTQIENARRGDDLVYCIGCGRILIA
jgi:uncharacterized protein